MVTLESAKQYLKLEYNEDDSLIEMLIEVAKSYVETELGTKFDQFDVIPKEIDLAMLLMISYWYDNRTAMVIVKNKQLTTEVKFGVATLLNPYKMRQV